MSRRPSVSQALDAAQGRDAFSAPDPTPEPEPVATPDTARPATARRTRRPRSKGPVWETENTRQAFYCPNDVVPIIHDEMEASGRSKSQIIVDAIREHLDIPPPEQ